MKHLDHFHYQIAGNPAGHKLVFLHGVMGSAANWLRIVPAFSADFHTLTFDQRGHGRSFHPLEGYHPRDYAQDLRNILDDLGWATCALVGHSMGGRNALEFASHFSQRVTCLVMEDIGPEASDTAIDRIERLLQAVPTPFSNRDEAQRFFTEDYPARIAFYPQPEVISRFLLANLTRQEDGTQDWRFAKNAILRSMREGRNEDRWDAFANLKMPVLVVRGSQSEDLSAATYQRMLASRPSAEGVEIQNAGHWVHFDQPAEFIDVLKRFFHRTLRTNL